MLGKLIFIFYFIVTSIDLDCDDVFREREPAESNDELCLDNELPFVTRARNYIF